MVAQVVAGYRRDKFSAPDLPVGEPMPTAANTGPRIGLSTVGGNPTITSPGTISGVHYTGNVFVAADDVTFVDCQFDGALYPSDLGANPAKVNLQVQHCMIAGVYTNGFDGVYFTRCRFGNQTDDFVDLNRGTVGGAHAYFDYCLFDRLQGSSANAEKHLDALQVLGADDIKIRHCVFNFSAPDADTRPQVTGIVTFETSFNGHTTDGWEVSDSEFTGGGYYQLDLYGPNGKLLRNTFHSASDAGNGYTYGSAPMARYPGFAYEQSGNTLDGAPYTGPTS